MKRVLIDLSTSTPADLEGLPMLVKGEVEYILPKRIREAIKSKVPIILVNYSRAPISTQQSAEKLIERLENWGVKIKKEEPWDKQNVNG